MSPTATVPASENFVDRRAPSAEGTAGFERRQFANSYAELTPEARELGLAIDQFKLVHRRRFVTAEELLLVVKSLGYRRD